MTGIDTQNSDVRSTFTEAVNRGRLVPAQADTRTEKPSKTLDQSPIERAKLDTVTLSDEGQKIVNLGRGRDLAQELKNAPIDENFANTLKQATDDVFRITNLFTQSLKSAIRWFR